MNYIPIKLKKKKKTKEVEKERTECALWMAFSLPLAAESSRASFWVEGALLPREWCRHTVQPVNQEGL